MRTKPELAAPKRLILVSTVIAGALTGVAGGGTAATCWSPKPAERAFAKAMNGERAAVERGKLRLDPELSKVARLHTRKMIREDLLHHSTKLRARVTNWDVIGENVGVGGTVESLHDAFMDSKGHRLNILYADYRYFGVGVRTDDRGRMWVTVVFQGSKNPGTTLAMPSC